MMKETRLCELIERPIKVRSYNFFGLAELPTSRIMYTSAQERDTDSDMRLFTISLRIQDDH